MFFAQNPYNIGMKVLLCIFLLIGCSAGANAQVYMQKTRAILHAALRKNSSLKELRPSVLRISDTLDPLPASAFVIEVPYKGQKKRWGVSAAHYLFVKPVVSSEQGPVPLRVAAQGSPGSNDIILFELPSSVLSSVKPLSLSVQPVHEGQQLHSLGFFKGSWHHEKNRIVQEVTPLRVVTSLKVNTTAKKLLREGACGGPILNNRNEVVGVHVGSSARKQEGYFVPAQHIKDIIIAHYQLNESEKPLLFNGRKISSINVNESIATFLTKRKGQVITQLELYHKEKRVDYNHLETLVPPESRSYIDEVVFLISQYPLSPSIWKPTKLQKHNFIKCRYKTA